MRGLPVRLRGQCGHSSAVLGKDDFIISDALNHASIIDGARLSRAKILVFRHKDIAHAEEQLASIKDEPGKKLLITDGVFSMDGDIGPLPGLCDLAEKYGAIMMVDDAHASGVLGRNGRGTVDHFNVHGRVDIQVGTLSKAIGALGGYVCGTRDLIDFLYHRARPFLFSTSHPPSVAATCIAAFDVLENEPERMEKLWENTRFWKKELGLLGFDIGGEHSSQRNADHANHHWRRQTHHGFSRELFKEGVLGTGIAFPTVPEGKARIRTIMTATHTKEELEQALAVLRSVGKTMGIWPHSCFPHCRCLRSIEHRPRHFFRRCRFQILRLPSHRSGDSSAAARMVEENKFLDRTGVELAIFSQHQIHIRFPVGLAGRVQAIHIRFELHGARDGIGYRRQQKKVQ